VRQLHDEPDELKERMIKRAEEVAEDLQGTAKNLDDESTEEERNNDDFTSRLDELVLECETCGWWCETGEICANGNCEDCCGGVCDDHDEEED
jgi:hypothetical protein